jgi:signal transduction histidine kinase
MCMKKNQEIGYNVFIMGDKNRRNQVISNLLRNVIKFTNSGIINMTLEKDTIDNKTSIYIRDTGQVIDQNILLKIFSKFVTKSKDGNRLRRYISKKYYQRSWWYQKMGRKQQRWMVQYFHLVYH